MLASKQKGMLPSQGVEVLEVFRDLRHLSILRANRFVIKSISLVRSLWTTLPIGPVAVIFYHLMKS